MLVCDTADMGSSSRQAEGLSQVASQAVAATFCSVPCVRLSLQRVYSTLPYATEQSSCAELKVDRGFCNFAKWAGKLTGRQLQVRQMNLQAVYTQPQAQNPANQFIVHLTWWEMERIPAHLQQGQQQWRVWPIPGQAAGSWCRPSCKPCALPGGGRPPAGAAPRSPL